MASITISAEDPLPSHWERRTDMITGLPFFLNHADQTTTWDDPRNNNQPRGMLNSRFAGSSPRIHRKTSRDPVFESFADSRGFLDPSFHQSTLPRHKAGGLGTRFIDMDHFFHPKDDNEEVEQPEPQPQWGTLDRRSRMKPRRANLQNIDTSNAPDYGSLPRFRRRERFSEPPCTERLYGKPDAVDFQIPVKHQDENRRFNQEDEQEPRKPGNRLFVKLRQKLNQLPTQEVLSPCQDINEPYSEQREPIRPKYEPVQSAHRFYEDEQSLSRADLQQPNRHVSELEQRRPKEEKPPQHTRRVYESEPASATDQIEAQEEIIEPSIKTQVPENRPTGLHMTSERISPMDTSPTHKLQETTATQEETAKQNGPTTDIETEQPEGNEAEQKQAAIDAALTKIAEIRKRVDGYKLEISHFEGDEKSKEFRYLTEMLTRATLDLDMIESLGEMLIRTKRKEAINYIDLCTQQLESKCQPSTN